MRVAFVILTIFGGSGILLYIAGWLFIPDEADADSAGERFFRDNNTLVIIAVVVVAVLVVGPCSPGELWDGGIGFGGIVLLLLVVAGVVALSRRGSPAARPTSRRTRHHGHAEPRSGSSQGPR